MVTAFVVVAVRIVSTVLQFNVLCFVKVVVKVVVEVVVMVVAEVEKDNYFTQTKFESKLFYPKKCVNCDKCEFATKQDNMYFATSIHLK